jgi:protein-tyrosine phosphatase
MKEAYELVAEKYGQEYAHALCVGNPLAAFMGKQMHPQAEPLHVFEDLEEKSWWQKLLSR